MSNELKGIINTQRADLSAANNHIVLMGGAIAGINIILMAFVCLYWTNPQFHTLITGKPL